MTEHVVPVDGLDCGVVTLHGRADTIRAAEDVLLALDSFGFGRLNVAWKALVPWCSDCRCRHETVHVDDGALVEP